MAPTFFAQLAAGCLLVVGLSDIRASGWKYLRLMAIVSVALLLLAYLFLHWTDASFDLRVWRATFAYGASLRTLAIAAIGTACAVMIVWLTQNAKQTEAVRPSQRTWLLLAGSACMIAAAAMMLCADPNLPGARLAPLAGSDAICALISATLGALVLGGVTAGMLLGHRYLTDTDMPIAPLRRLTNIYLIALVVRMIWAAAMAWPILGDTFRPSGGALWFWVVLTIRGGIGLIGAAIFAWMIRDCVNVRATQSATAIFYLSMVFVYLGELAAQYLLRTEGLAV